ncbi:hypothetical protein PC41400_14930 [Paenibacillus chitinolyticus]|uniref:Uncharacterized protein n=1 Tax=Paenibacillus chitinolyticus TaxID=79263 RepID=A0A410WXD5_9BACL|nr:hypothetical protein [Paenibacillus chitinolyticus]MCY9592361.1 hypothetical protein [Paenibacillus chitinolyticus]MCY9599822.1 hypothetical protein [Paenibacillus chitinolyticus]QAV18901.1 hypothetical protein PC41400_14930 [Paenibacillus chitinolyticus]
MEQIKKEILKLNLVLENTDCIEIENKHIGRISILDIKTSIVATRNSTCKFNECDHFALASFRDGDEQYKLPNDFMSTSSKYTRLKGNDITSIHIIYNDYTEEELYVPWGDSEYKNDYQHTYINEHGDLFIVINKNKNIEDEFPYDLEDTACLEYMLFWDC